MLIVKLNSFDNFHMSIFFAWDNIIYNKYQNMKLIVAAA